MTPTRRTVLGWLLAAVIAPPRLTPVDYFPDIPSWLAHMCYGPIEDHEWTLIWTDMAQHMEQELTTWIEVGIS